jgi:hypothetical protein
MGVLDAAKFGEGLFSAYERDVAQLLPREHSEIIDRIARCVAISIGEPCELEVRFSQQKDDVQSDEFKFPSIFATPIRFFDVDSRSTC